MPNKKTSRVVDIVAVGQTPPPHGGQAIMIEKMLAASYYGVRLHHVRMAFSDDMESIGRFQVRKLWHLLVVIVRIVRARFSTGASVLYYPPAGPDRVPVYRDLVILLSTRWLFRKTIFHFHAGGVSELYPRFGMVLRKLFRAAYFGADVGVKVSNTAPPDPEKLRAQKSMVVHNGIEDLATPTPTEGTDRESIPTILYVGVVRESKGVEVLLRAAEILKAHGAAFRIEVVGRSDAAYRSRLEGLIRDMGIAPNVDLRGVLTGTAKVEAFRDAAIFCFPTFFEAETSGVVLLEAMQFRLPIVATHWRGIPDLVQEDENGYLVPTNDAGELAGSLAILLADPSLRKRLGERGRMIYEQRFTLESYRSGLQQVFDVVAA